MTLSLWSRRILLPFAVTRAGLLLAGVLALGLIGSRTIKPIVAG